MPGLLVFTAEATYGVGSLRLIRLTYTVTSDGFGRKMILSTLSQADAKCAMSKRNISLLHA